MQVLCNLFALSHGVKQLMRAVLRVRGHEAYDEIAVDIIYLAQKRCKIHLALAVVSVGIDILPEQGYLFISAPDKLARLADYNIAAAAALASADIGNYTVSAEVIAPVHYRQPRFKSAVSVQRQIFRDNAVGIFDIKYTLAGRQSAVKQLREFMCGMSAENYIDKRIALLNLFGYPLLLHHASAEDYFEVGILLFYFFERTDISEESVFGVLADGAGVKKRYIRVFRLFCESEAHFFKQAFESLTVGNVALTAESVDISERPTPVKARFKHCMYKSAELHLSVELLLRNNYVSVFGKRQISSPPKNF